MGSLGFSLYRPLGGMNWAPVLGLRQRSSRFTGPAYKSPFNPASRTWGMRLHAYFLNPINYQFVSFSLQFLVLPNNDIKINNHSHMRFLN